jgi:hypothetical protein
LRQPDSRTAERWCIFDNTALGHATDNALGLAELVQASQPSPLSRARST